LLRQAIASTGRQEVKNLGDGLMVAFGSASGAVSCAVAVQQLFERRYDLPGVGEVALAMAERKELVAALRETSVARPKPARSNSMCSQAPPRGRRGWHDTERCTCRRLRHTPTR
jgi:class 3 adenylate cyclase